MKIFQIKLSPKIARLIKKNNNILKYIKILKFLSIHYAFIKSIYF